MARFKKKRKSGGGGSGGSNPWAGTVMVIFGSIAMVIALVMFGVAIQQLDTSYTAAATYTEMTSLTSIMGVFGMVIFLFFMSIGLAGIAGGTFVNVKRNMGGGWLDLGMLAISSAVTLVIALIMFGVNLTQLNTAYTTANSTTNISHFVGLLSIMGIWGIVIFVTMIGSGLIQGGFAAYGGYKRIRG